MVKYSQRCIRYRALAVVADLAAGQRHIVRNDYSVHGSCLEGVRRRLEGGGLEPFETSANCGSAKFTSFLSADHLADQPARLVTNRSAILLSRSAIYIDQPIIRLPCNSVSHYNMISVLRKISHFSRSADCRSAF